ncbi:MAG: MFS transporter [Bacteroidaceae bacterium]|nr:MFS transporter [Bacteroidaceae bacterium]
MSTTQQTKMTNFRWVICAMLFLATTVNYMDRQVLSLTWKDFIAPEFHWTDSDYGKIAGLFGLVYGFANFFAGRIIDYLGTKKGYLWAIFIWSLGACLHALCGWATMQYVGIGSMAEMMQATGDTLVLVVTVSVWFFISARVVLAVGEAGNFPSAVKVTAEYFPKKDRAFATSIFNAGSTIGALVAPLTIPVLARVFKDMGVGNGWEAAFIIIGGLGFLWMAFWVFLYKDVRSNPRVNTAELTYIQQDDEPAAVTSDGGRSLGYLEFFRTRQMWAIVLGKFITDGVWWFFLFWTPAYISDIFGYSSDTTMAQWLIFVLYAITILSIYGGKLPSIIMDKTGGNAYESRMKAMFIFALIPLLGITAQPLGAYSPWLVVIIIGIMGAAHQSWSANLFTVGSDLFNHNSVATITGINGLAGGLSCLLINWLSGLLITYADETQMAFVGYQGKTAAYMLIFCFCSVAYLLGWICMKTLVPKYKPVQ